MTETETDGGTSELLQEQVEKMRDQIQAELVHLLQTSEKIPYTDEGCLMLKKAYLEALKSRAGELIFQLKIWFREDKKKQLYTMYVSGPKEVIDQIFNPLNYETIPDLGIEIDVIIQK